MADITGTSGDDVLVGTDGDDLISAFEGSDYVTVGHGGNDIVDGGSDLDGRDFDYLDFAASATGVFITIEASGGTATYGGGDTVEFVNFEGIAVSNLADTVSVADGVNSNVVGEAGGDTLIGGSGSNLLRGGSGNDIIDGGGGIDVASYLDNGNDAAGAPTQGVYVNLTTGTATDNWGFTDTLSNIEGVHGSSLGDTIIGIASFEAELRGFGGDDIITTGIADSGDDHTFIEGGSGDDTINTHTGAAVFGGAGSDRIIANATAFEDTNYVQVRYQDSALAIFANLTAGVQGPLAGGADATGFRISDGWGGTDLVSYVTSFRDSAHDDEFRVDSTYTSLYGNWVEIALGGGDDNVVFTSVDVARISYRRTTDGAVHADMEAGFATDRNASDNFVGMDTFIGANEFRGSTFGDLIYGSSGEERIRGDAGSDTIDGRDGNDLLEGEGGNDTIDGGNGDDTLDGGDGSDTASFAAAVSSVHVDLDLGTASGMGTDTLVSIENAIGGSGDDSITGSNVGNRLEGGTGNDTLFGLDGNDTLLGGTGSDLISGGLGIDRLYGHDGDDRLYGDDGNDFIWGGIGADSVIGGDGNDTVNGNGGHDDIAAGGGNDRLYGGGDRDVIQGGDGDDSIYGQAGDDNLGAGLGGGLGDDVVHGGGGNDLINGNGGADRLYGGAGSDLVYGGNDADYMHGGSGNDTLYGQAGDDNMFGFLGVDVMNGGDGDDRLNGGDGIDTLRGGNGNDILTGGDGNDRLWGNAGNDRFNFDDGWGRDTIHDFANNGIEKINLSAVAGINGIGDLTITDSGGSTLVTFGTNSIEVVGVTAAQLDGSDFIL